MVLGSPKRILVVQIGKIGDMILTTPLFFGLKQFFPTSKLTVLASNVNKDVALNNEYVDEVIVYRKSILDSMLFLNPSMKNIDLWIDTKDNYSKTSALLLKVFKPKKSLGFNSGKNIFDVSLNEYKKGNHATQISLSPLNYLDNKNDNYILTPSFNIPEEIKSKVEKVSQPNPYLKRVLINISAGDPGRYLANDKWVYIINKINNTHLYCFNLSGLEKDMESIDYILKETRRINIKYMRTVNIIETAEIVRTSDYIVSADTSIVHICSAFNKPVVALYPNVRWNLEKFAPLSDYNEVIVSNSRNSVDSINAEEIVVKFRKLVEDVNSGNAESRTRVRKEDH